MPHGLDYRRSQTPEAMAALREEYARIRKEESWRRKVDAGFRLLLLSVLAWFAVVLLNQF